MFKMKLDNFMWTINLIVLHCCGLSNLHILITCFIIDFIIIIVLIKKYVIKKIKIQYNRVAPIEDWPEPTEEYGESNYSYSSEAEISHSYGTDIGEQNINHIIKTPTIIKKTISNKERIDILTLDESSQDKIIEEALNKWRRNGEIC
jgi:hypothetical protein